MIKTLQLLAITTLFVQTSIAQDFLRIEDDAGIEHRHLDEYIMGGGAALFDSNNDGYLDIYITGGELRDKLYINNQNDTYSEVGISAGFGNTDTIKTNGVCTGDIDNDGDRDIFVTTGDGQSNLLFENQGDGTYTNISTIAGIADNVWSTSCAMGDYNMDGYLDIYVGNYVTIIGLPNIPFYEQLDQPIDNYFYVNNGDNTFTENANLLNVDISGGTLAVTFTDFDRDNDMDIYVANDFGGLFGVNSFFRNNYPTNSFTNVAADNGTAASINAMGIAIGDYDGDDNFDYYISNMGANVFYQNEGDDTFQNVADVNNTSCLEGVSWGTFFFDYDNDTYLDLFIANGGVLMQNINRNQTNSLYSLGDDYLYSDVPGFTDVNDSAISRGAIHGDIDNDGDLDIFVVNINDTLSTFNAHLLQNNNLTPTNAWLEVEVQGSTNNYDGYGTSVIAFFNGDLLVREIDGGSSYQSQNSSIAHFGLGENDLIDSIQITWLGGDVQRLYNVSSSQYIHIIEDVNYSFDSQSICEGDSISFRDTWVYTPGTYYDSTYTVFTLDSVFSLTVHYIDTIMVEEYVEIVNGDSIYLEGAYQTEEGTYMDFYTSAAGCDSIVITHLSVDFSNGIEEINSEDWNIYPNPNNGLFTLQFASSVSINEIRIYSIVGKEVMYQKVNDIREKIELNLLDQSEGIYFIHVNTGERKFTKKVIVNK